MIDLHIHSTFSDGSLTPRELVERGRQLGLKALALTDHDTCAGVGPFLAAGRSSPAPNDPPAATPVCVPGVEISVEVPRGTLHLLGYYVDPNHPGLTAALRGIREGREIRNAEILSKLRRLGFDLSWDEVRSRAGDEVVGRPHVAQAMVARGWVRTSEEAFEKYLAKGRPAYADRYRLSVADALRVLREAGGIPVLAHPFTLELDHAGLRATLRRMKDLGLGGVEVYYSEHTPEQTAEYRALAAELDLAITGGSDFHGTMNPLIELGRGFGSLNVPDHLLEELQRRLG